MLKLALEEQGVNTNSGHYDSAEIDGGTSNTTSRESQSLATADNGDAHHEEEANTEERSEGVYL